jgi:hypothetical protein
LQHTWAEIEHAYYKGTTLPRDIRRRVSILAGLLELADNEFVAVRDAAKGAEYELPACRAEGVAELVPKFSIDLPNSEVLLKSGLPDKALILYANTNITNRLLENNETGVELYIEGDASGRARKGVLLRKNALAFSDVFPLPYSSSGGTISLQIVGLRVNALQLGVSSTLALSTIAVSLAIDDRERLTDDPIYLIPRLKVAGIYFSLRTASSVSPTLQASGSSRAAFFQTTHSAQFQDAFRPADKERSPTENSTNVQGTRLTLHLSSIPVGSHVFVTVTNLPHAEASSFQLTEADTYGDGPFKPLPASIPATAPFRVGMAEVNISDMAAKAVWECVGSVKSKSISFGVMIESPAENDISEISVAGNYAPLSLVNTANSHAPIPRFGQLSTPIKVSFDK